jgi:hypothetical protein
VTIRLAQVRKAVAALAGGAAVAVSAGLLHGAAEHWTTGILAVATAVLTYYVPNAAGPAAAEHRAGTSNVRRVVDRDDLPPRG